MDRETIEAKDQRLIKKFRSIVEQKKQSEAPVQTPKRGGRFPAAVLVLAVLILVPAWLFTRDRSSDSLPAVQEQVASETVTEEAIPATEPAPAPVEPEPLTAEALPAQPPPLEKARPLSSEPVQAPEVDAVVMEAPAIVSGVRIAAIQACGGVADRECVSPARSFSLADAVKPTVWMTVMADHPPFTLTHAYYLNDRPYCTVPLTIGYPRTRTWSRITVNLETHLGAWRVDVVDDQGQVLDRVDFQVIP